MVQTFFRCSKLQSRDLASCKLSKIIFRVMLPMLLRTCMPIRILGRSFCTPPYWGCDASHVGSRMFVFPLSLHLNNCTRSVFLLVQCGADSLGNDRLGCFNLTTKGHGSVCLLQSAISDCHVAVYPLFKSNQILKISIAPPTIMDGSA